MMLIIFSASSIPSSDLPQFGILDFLIKKTSHALGYAVLGLCYLSALSAGQREGRYGLALLLAMTYAVIDEIHQGFVPGRHPSPIDVGIDSSGVGLALIIRSLLRRPKRGC